MLVHKNMKEAKKRQKDQADKKSKDEEFQVGDPVYLKNNRRQNKLDKKWLPYYRIIEQKGPVSFVIKNQLTGATTKYHARQLRLADISHWPISFSQEIPEDGRSLRRNNYVVPPEKESDSSEEEDIQPEPLEREIQFKKREREESSDEEDIPLAELQQRIRAKKIMDDQQQNTESTEETIEDYESESENEHPESQIPLDNFRVPLNEDMEVDEVKIGLGFTPTPKQRKPIPKPRKLNKQNKFEEDCLAVLKQLVIG